MLSVRKHFYNNGQLQWLELLRDEIPDGEQKTWRENGQPCLREFQQDGKVEGIRQIKYDNGNIDTVAQYRNGKLDGNLRIWDGNGSVLLNRYIIQPDNKRVDLTNRNRRGFPRIKRLATLHLLRQVELDMVLIPDLFRMACHCA